MKVTAYEGPKTITRGDFETIEIGIGRSAAAQGMILDVLTNTIYPDKISAIWREYGCNAMDANIEAGMHDLPIEITLPSSRASEAVIRDFGDGMSEEQMTEVYCMLGESTKRDSNAVTGTYGIGAKAGYAYGNMFTVTTWHKGKRTIYQFFRDNGRLKMTKVSVTDSNEKSGTEVKVPVRNEDLEEFHQKAESVFRYFKVKPVVGGWPSAPKDQHVFVEPLGDRVSALAFAEIVSLHATSA